MEISNFLNNLNYYSVKFKYTFKLQLIVITFNSNRNGNWHKGISWNIINYPEKIRLGRFINWN